MTLPVIVVMIGFATDKAKSAIAGRARYPVILDFS
jgi:hypothetical protein